LTEFYYEDEGLSVNEAADYTGLSLKAIKSRCDRGTLQFNYGPKGERRIPVEELDRITQRSLDDLPFSPYTSQPTFEIPKAELWGDGRAELIEPSTTDRWEVGAFFSDIHAPYHDKALIDSAIELLENLDPHFVVLNGDINDFFGISRFNKAQERSDLLQMELDMGIEIRRAFRAAAPNARFYETIGNHEERLLTYPAFNAPMMRSLRALKPSSLLGLDELEIQQFPQHGFRLRNEFVVEHGVVIRKDSGGSARARLNDTLISGIMGHTHRMDSARRTGFRELEWYEQGCMCLLNPDYVKGGANWKQGFAIGTFSTVTSNFNIQLIPAIGRGFIFDNKHYGNTDSEIDLWSGPAENVQVNLVGRT
jgi:predicted phosphodiesterase